MRDLYIHIGAHKTGTTTIQKAFHKNQPALKKAGVLYPRCNWYHHSQHRLAFALKGMRDPKTGYVPELDGEIAALLSALSTGTFEKAFISSEELFSCAPAKIAAFKAALDTQSPVPLRYHIVATVRRPDTLLLSIYNQKAKQPGNNFARTVAAFVEAPTELDKDLSFNSCIGAWMDVFGEDRTQVLQYEDGDTLGQILKVLNVPIDTISLPLHENASVPGAVIELMRIAKFNKMAPKLQMQLYKLAIEELKDLPPYYLSDEDREKVIGHFESGNDILFERLGRPNPYTTASFTPPPNNTKRPNVMMRDAMRLIETLLINN